MRKKKSRKITILMSDEMFNDFEKVSIKLEVSKSVLLRNHISRLINKHLKRKDNSNEIED